MQDSILMTIRKLVCGDPYADHFDTDLLIHINACFSILNQLGVGPENGFVVTDETQSWSSYVADNRTLNMVKTYVTLKVKKIFDPPLTSSVLEAMDKEISQLEWRLNVAVDPVKPTSTSKTTARRRSHKTN
jgi:hypothetical protein